MNKKTTRPVIKIKKLLVLSLMLIAAAFMTIPVLADCNGEPEAYRKKVVTYQEITRIDNADNVFDSRCHYYRDASGRRVCQIRMRGTLFYPLASAYHVLPFQPPAQFPALVVNHGSEHTFPAESHLCVIANYYVPQGFLVFAPFRRGQGDDTDPGNRSTGIYVEDMVTDFNSPNPVYPHNTTCLTGDCYRSQLLNQQAAQEIAAAMDFMKARTDVKRYPDDSGDYRIGIMGISYGGRVTVYANALDLGQRAAVAFSPAAEGWGALGCSPDNQNCGSASRVTLMGAAANAQKPAFYLQAKWDYDTRPTTDLAYAHATGGNDPIHAKPFMSSIFAFTNPCPDHPCTDADYQSIHQGFFAATDRWGDAVTDFLRRNGVK